MVQVVEVEIAGLTRKLPLKPINEEVAIALFVCFNDVPLTVAAAETLLSQVPEFDVIITEEAQGIPLAFEMSRQAQKDRCIIARKSAKAYMEDVAAIQLMEADGNEQIITRRYLSQQDADYLKNKRVLIVDDMALYGRTLNLLSDLVEAMGGYVVGQATILQHELEELDSRLISLKTLPVYSLNGEVIEK